MWSVDFLEMWSVDNPDATKNIYWQWLKKQNYPHIAHTKTQHQESNLTSYLGSFGNLGTRLSRILIKSNDSQIKLYTNINFDKSCIKIHQSYVMFWLCASADVLYGHI